MISLFSKATLRALELRRPTYTLEKRIFEMAFFSRKGLWSKIQLRTIYQNIISGDFCYNRFITLIYLILIIRLQSSPYCIYVKRNNDVQMKLYVIYLNLPFVLHFIVQRRPLQVLENDHFSTFLCLLMEIQQIPLYTRNTHGTHHACILVISAINSAFWDLHHLILLRDPREPLICDLRYAYKQIRQLSD